MCLSKVTVAVFWSSDTAVLCRIAQVGLYRAVSTVSSLPRIASRWPFVQYMVIGLHSLADLWQLLISLNQQFLSQKTSQRYQVGILVHSADPPLVSSLVSWGCDTICTCGESWGCVSAWFSICAWGNAWICAWDWVWVWDWEGGASTNGAAGSLQFQHWIFMGRRNSWKQNLLCQNSTKFRKV